MFSPTSIELQSIGFKTGDIRLKAAKKMSVMLVAADFDWFLDVHLDDDLLDALLVQIERGKAKPSVSRIFHRHLESSVPDAIGAALDTDLRPPSENQRVFAKRIAEKLNIDVPLAAWRYRSEMGEFLEHCVAQLSGSTQSRSKPRRSLAR